MKPRFVSAVAVLFCCGIFVIVGLFGYSRYIKAQAENAAFRAQLQNPGQGLQVPLETHMPAQLPPRSSSAAGEVSASPRPAQP